MTYQIKYVSSEPVFFEIEARNTVDALKQAFVLMQVENNHDNFVLSCINKQNNECIAALRLN